MTTSTDSGPGSLRAALVDAERDPGADSIAVSATGSIALLSPLPRLSTAVAIHGPGPGELTVAPDPAAAEAREEFRVLEVGASGSVEVAGLALTGGRAIGAGSAAGGGVLNFGSLALTDAVVSGNLVRAGPGHIASGGGIANHGELVVRASAVRANRVVAPGAGSIAGRAEGGGIASGFRLVVEDSAVTDNVLAGFGPAAFGSAIAAGGEAAVRRATLARNLAELPPGAPAVGALHNASGTLAVENSTVAGNAGGVSTGLVGETTIRSSTIASGAGPNLIALAGDRPNFVELQNTILAAPGPAAVNCATEGTDSQLTSRGHNLADDRSCGFLTGPADRQGIDPALAPLAPSGALAETLTPEPASPAIDAGAADGLATDQRGLPRPASCGVAGSGSDGSDIGAVEVQPVCPGAPPAPPAEPSSGPTEAERLALGRPRLRRRSGTAILPVTVSGPGHLRAGGPRIRPAALAVEAPATAEVTIRGDGATRRALRRRGRARVRVEISLSRAGAVVANATRSVRLVRARPRCGRRC